MVTFILTAWSSVGEFSTTTSMSLASIWVRQCKTGGSNGSKAKVAAKRKEVATNKISRWHCWQPLLAVMKAKARGAMR